MSFYYKKWTPGFVFWEFGTVFDREIFFKRGALKNNKLRGKNKKTSLARFLHGFLLQKTLFIIKSPKKDRLWTNIWRIIWKQISIMKEFKSCVKRLRQMDELIRNSCTGKARSFASKIGVSERSLYDYLALMKELVEDDGVTITYNTALKTFQYTGSGRLKIIFQWVNDE
jgi:hypothetical protein